MSLADMDRETRENYSVVIQAKDMGGQMGGLAGTTTVNITLTDINDNPPMFDQSKRASARPRPPSYRSPCSAFPEALSAAAEPELGSPSSNLRGSKTSREKMCSL